MSNTGYSGFENPEEQYYGTDPAIPVLYTGSWQIRQFGVGQANGTGRAPSVTSALANPPAAMVTAEDDSITNATNLYAVTANDKYNYWPAS